MKSAASALVAGASSRTGEAEVLNRKIKTTRGVRISGEAVEAGTVLELKAHEAVSMVASNKAVFVEETPEPPPEPEPEPEPEPKAKSTGGKRK